MIIPNVPKEPLLHEDGKNVHPAWGSFFDFIINQLQQNLGSEGIVLPQQATTDINKLVLPQSIGAIIYDSTTNVAKINLSVGGTPTWKTITTS